MTEQKVNRDYYRKCPGEEKFIVIEHGSLCYRDADWIEDQDHCDRANDNAGVTRDEVEAATTCSMFDRWEHFDDIVESERDRRLRTQDGEEGDQ